MLRATLAATSITHPNQSADCPQIGGRFRLSNAFFFLTTRNRKAWNKKDDISGSAALILIFVTGIYECVNNQWSCFLKREREPRHLCHTPACQSHFSHTDRWRRPRNISTRCKFATCVKAICSMEMYIPISFQFLS